MEFLKKVGAFTGIALGAFVLSALAWTVPTTPPPDGNVAPPLNTSNVPQIKYARLGIVTPSVLNNALDIMGISSFWGNVIVGAGGVAKIQINDGNQAEGKVLTSDNEGWARWATLPSSGSNQNNSLTTSEQYTLNLGDPSMNLGSNWNACFITSMYRDPANDESGPKAPFGCSVLNGGNGWQFSVTGNSNSTKGETQCIAQCIRLQ